MRHRKIKKRRSVFASHKLFKSRKRRPWKYHDAQQIIDQNACQGNSKPYKKSGKIFRPKHFSFRYPCVQETIIFAVIFSDTGVPIQKQTPDWNNPEPQLLKCMGRNTPGQETRKRWMQNIRWPKSFGIHFRILPIRLILIQNFSYKIRHRQQEQHCRRYPCLYGSYRVHQFLF